MTTVLSECRFLCHFNVDDFNEIFSTLDGSLTHGGYAETLT